MRRGSRPPDCLVDEGAGDLDQLDVLVLAQLRQPRQRLGVVDARPAQDDPDRPLEIAQTTGRSPFFTTVMRCASRSTRMPTLAAVGAATASRKAKAKVKIFHMGSGYAWLEVRVQSMAPFLRRERQKPLFTQDEECRPGRRSRARFGGRR